MKRKEYVEAYLVYTEALEETEDREELMKFYLNKAIVCSKLNLVQEYKDNIAEVLKKDGNNRKAIYHKIKCLILMEKYDEALEFMMKKKEFLNEEIDQ